MHCAPRRHRCGCPNSSHLWTPTKTLPMQCRRPRRRRRACARRWPWYPDHAASTPPMQAQASDPPPPYAGQALAGCIPARRASPPRRKRLRSCRSQTGRRRGPPRRRRPARLRAPDRRRRMQNAEVPEALRRTDRALRLGQARCEPTAIRAPPRRWPTGDEDARDLAAAVRVLPLRPVARPVEYELMMNYVQRCKS